MEKVIVYCTLHQSEVNFEIFCSSIFETVAEREIPMKLVPINQFYNGYIFRVLLSTVVYSSYDVSTK